MDTGLVVPVQTRYVSRGKLFIVQSRWSVKLVNIVANALLPNAAMGIPIPAKSAMTVVKMANQPPNAIQAVSGRREVADNAGAGTRVVVVLIPAIKVKRVWSAHVRKE